jgi:uncharacterized tellurite resistance protein B-like protein
VQVFEVQVFEVQVFEVIKSFVADLANNDGQPGDLGDDEFRVAYAALLVHAAAIDGSVSESERDRLKSLLMRRFELDQGATADLIARAAAADERAVDLYHFTRLLNERLDEPGRLRMIETMWTVAYADGAPSDYENNLIWRVADLLGVSQAERVALRQRAAACSDPA